MSDQSKYINAFVDTCISTMTEQMQNLIQAKAQLKVANDIVMDRDNYIKVLQEEIVRLNKENNSKDDAVSRAITYENENVAIKNKLAQMEILTKQYNELKLKYKELVSEKTPTKKEINTKEKIPVTGEVIGGPVQVEKNEDF